MSLYCKENLWGRFYVIREDTEQRIGIIFRNPEHTAYKFYPDAVDPLDEDTAYNVYKQLKFLNGPDYVG